VAREGREDTKLIKLGSRARRRQGQHEDVGPGYVDHNAIYGGKSLGLRSEKGLRWL